VPHPEDHAQACRNGEDEPDPTISVDAGENLTSKSVGAVIAGLENCVPMMLVKGYTF